MMRLLLFQSSPQDRQVGMCAVKTGWEESRSRRKILFHSWRSEDPLVIIDVSMACAVGYRVRSRRMMIFVSEKFAVVEVYSSCSHLFGPFWYNGTCSWVIVLLPNTRSNLPFPQFSSRVLSWCYYRVCRRCMCLRRMLGLLHELDPQKVLLYSPRWLLESNRKLQSRAVEFRVIRALSGKREKERE